VELIPGLFFFFSFNIDNWFLTWGHLDMYSVPNPMLSEMHGLTSLCGISQVPTMVKMVLHLSAQCHRLLLHPLLVHPMPLRNLAFLMVARLSQVLHIPPPILATRISMVLILMDQALHHPLLLIFLPPLRQSQLLLRPLMVARQRQPPDLEHLTLLYRGRLSKKDLLSPYPVSKEESR
jgi:hypothetical protein